MREVNTCEVKAHLSALLDEVAGGESIIITRHGIAVARLTALEGSDREAAVTAAETLRGLRKRIGWATTEEILRMRNAGRRRPLTISGTP